MSKMIGKEPDTLNSLLINIYFYEINKMDYILILFNIHNNSWAFPFVLVHALLTCSSLRKIR